MGTMQSTLIYLTAEQKAGEAQQHQVGVEVRSAVDSYLAGVTPQELELLDVASKRAKEEIDAMLKTANEIVDSHECFLREMEALRGKKTKS